jgi:transposase
LEFGLSTVQPLVQVWHLEERCGGSSIPRLGSFAVGFYGSSRPSTCCRLPKKETDEEALGRSRGGFGSKLHISVDIQGQPVNICLGPGEEHDITRAEELLGDERPDCVIADKGYDSDELVAAIRRRGAEAVIPPRSNRTTKRRWNKRKYKLRNLAERFINRIKHYRRVATRYEKTARNYLSFVHLASALVLLGVTVNTT